MGFKCLQKGYTIPSRVPAEHSAYAIVEIINAKQVAQGFAVATQAPYIIMIDTDDESYAVISHTAWLYSDNGDYIYYVDFDGSVYNSGDMPEMGE